MTANLTMLPSDVILELVSYLNYDDLKTVAQLNLEFHSIFKDQNFVNITNKKQFDKYLHRLSLLLMIGKPKPPPTVRSKFTSLTSIPSLASLSLLHPNSSLSERLQLQTQQIQLQSQQLQSQQSPSDKEIEVEPSPFSKSSAIKFIKYVLERGVIAGGSVVYAMNDFVPIDSVGDIDVFVNDPLVLINMLEYLKEKYGATFTSINSDLYFSESDNDIDYIGYRTDEDYEEFYTEFLQENPDYDEDDEDDDDYDILHDEFEYWKKSNRKMSIVVVNIPGCKITVQFVFQKYSSAIDVIKTFDLDYVKCAIHKNTSYRTECCKESHRTRTVICATEFPPSFRRFEKAQKKGFKTPIFGKDARSPHEKKLTSIPKLRQLECLTKREEKVKIDYLLSEVYISNFKSKRCYRQKFFGDVIVRLGNHESSTHLFTIQIRVTDIIPNLFEKEFEIEPIIFNGHQITRCCYAYALKPNMSYIVSVEIFIVCDYKFKIHNIHNFGLPIKHL